MSYNADKVTFIMVKSRNMNANITFYYFIILDINNCVALAIKTPLQYDFAP